jgi:hypothetical protein
MLSGLQHLSPVAFRPDAEVTVKYLDKIANIAVIIAVAVFLTLVIRGEFFRRTSAPAHSPSAMVGTTIHLPGIHFSSQHDSLVLGISTTCHYCYESLPFYKQLADRVQGRVEVFAILPQAQTEGSRYLATAGISSIHVVSADLGSIGIYATPTLLLVGSDGKVKSEWQGKQDEAGQHNILAALLPDTSAVEPRN